MTDTDYIPMNDTYSLLPILDTFLMIMPTVYMKNRNKCLCILMIIISCLVLLSIPISEIYFGITYYLTNDTMKQETMQIFVFIMYLFPFCGSFARLYFFAKYFDNDIWHNNNNESSHLMRQSSNIKNNIRKSFRIGFIINLILYLLFFMVNIWSNLIFYQSFISSNKMKQEMTIWLLIKLSIQFLFGNYPDLALISVARIEFTECYLNILNFSQSLNVINSFSSNTSSIASDIISFDLIDKYLKLYKEISLRCKQLSIFVSIWIIMIAFFFWFLITICFFTDWEYYNIDETNKFMIPMYIQLAVFTIQAFCAAMFMLYPAFKMTEVYDNLYERVNEIIQILLKDTTCKYLHDDECIDNLTKNNNYGNINVTELHKQLILIGQQKANIELIYRLKYIINEKPVYYSLLGLKLSKYSVRDFIIAIFMAKIFSYLWGNL